MSPGRFDIGYTRHIQSFLNENTPLPINFLRNGLKGSHGLDNVVNILYNGFAVGTLMVSKPLATEMNQR